MATRSASGASIGSSAATCASSAGPALGVEERQLGAQQPDALRAGRERGFDLGPVPAFASRRTARPSVVTAGSSRSRSPRSTSARRARCARLRRSRVAGSIWRITRPRSASTAISSPVGIASAASPTPVTSGIPSERATIAACAVLALPASTMPATFFDPRGDVARAEILGHHDRSSRRLGRHPRAPGRRRGGRSPQIGGARGQRGILEPGERRTCGSAAVAIASAAGARPRRPRLQRSRAPSRPPSSCWSRRSQRRPSALGAQRARRDRRARAAPGQAPSARAHLPARESRPRRSSPCG